MKYELRAWALNMEHISDIYAMLLLPFLFSSEVDKRDIVSTPSAEKNNNKSNSNMPSMHKIGGRWNRNVRFKFFAEQYFAVYFKQFVVF